MDAGRTALQPGLPIGFAHRGGAHASAAPNTLSAFAAALALGATALESDVMQTPQGIPVLGHPSPLVMMNLRRLDASKWRALPSVAALYEHCGSGFDLALDMAAPEAAPQIVELARGHGASSRLWLTYWNLGRMRQWRAAFPEVRLVFPRLLVPGRDPGALLDRLRDAGIDALNVHGRQCTAALVEAAHARGVLLFAWGLRGGPAVVRALGSGSDGVFADDVPSMVAALRDARPRRMAAAHGEGA